MHDLTQFSEEELERLQDELLDKMIEKARTDFHTFVKLMAPVVLPEEFTDGRHIELICKELQEVAESVWDKTKEPKRLQLFLPPGSMKSKLASNLFPAWCLGVKPNWCFLAIGADFDFAVDNFGRPTKDLVDSERYKAIFPYTSLKKDVQSAGRWDTTKKGRFVARGVGQGLAGRRAHISICDDVINEQTTDSGRKDINKWYQKGLRTRLLPRGAEIIINTRWFVEDLSGHMLKVDGELGKNEKTARPWKVVSLPAILNEEASKYLRNGLDKDETRFEVGTSFWPEFWPTKVLLEKRETMAPGEWAALYQQNPISEEGGIVKRSNFKIWHEPKPPACKYVLISMDTAFSTSEEADFSAYTVWGIFQRTYKDFEDGPDLIQDCMIMLGAGKGRWDFAELCNKVQDLNAEKKPDFIIIEKKASGQSLIPELRKRSLPIVEYIPERDKRFRLQATTPYFQSSRIWVPCKDQQSKDQAKDWAEEVIGEVISFPKAPHDDFTDTVSQAVLWMRDSFQIDNDGYTNEWEDDWSRPHKKTYWSSLLGKQ